MIAADNTTQCREGTDFQDATEGGKHEGMAQANLPEDNVRQLQRTGRFSAPLNPDATRAGRAFSLGPHSFLSLRPRGPSCHHGAIRGAGPDRALGRSGAAAHGGAARYAVSIAIGLPCGPPGGTGTLDPAVRVTAGLAGSWSTGIPMGSSGFAPSGRGRRGVGCERDERLERSAPGQSQRWRRGPRVAPQNEDRCRWPHRGAGDASSFS